MSRHDKAYIDKYQYDEDEHIAWAYMLWFALTRYDASYQRLYVNPFII
jgi:hypothetical protein